MKYGVFDADGKAVAFYSDDIHSQIPSGALPITDADYAAYLNEAHLWRRNPVNGTRQSAPAPVVTVEGARARRLTQLAAQRFTVETGGITVGGAEVRTDLESQAKITGAWCRVQQDPAAVIDWKGANGWQQLDKPTVEAVAAAVGVHVQACYTAERAHTEALAALTTVEEIQGYDITLGWP